MYYTNIRTTYLLLLITLLITACAHIPPPPPPTAATLALWQTHQTQLNKINSWRLNGRIAIQTETESWTANVYWQQRGDTYQLRFNAPVGQGAMLLEGNQAAVTLRTAENKTYIADNPDTLIAEVLRLPIPVSGLHFWIRGIPAPTSVPTDYQINTTGSLYSLQQDGWNIEYWRYTDDQPVMLPNKLFLENHEFKVKIVISQWNL